MKKETMTFYFDLNHPTKLLTALALVYDLDRNVNRNFKHYSSSEYETVEPGSVFFLVDDEKGGLDFNTRRLASDGFTVFAIKFPPNEPYVPFDVADAVIKIWSRALKTIDASMDAKIYKYHYRTDLLKVVA
jgi:hypothetical protein